MVAKTYVRFNEESTLVRESMSTRLREILDSQLREAALHPESAPIDLGEDTYSMFVEADENIGYRVNFKKDEAASKLHGLPTINVVQIRKFPR